MKTSICVALLLLASTQAFADESSQAYSVRAGTLITKKQNFMLVGVGIELKTTETWRIEASADLALSDGLSLPTEENGLFGTFPVSLSGLYQPLPGLKLSPFLEFGGGVNIISEADPDPFLLGGGGASYQGSDWAINTDVRFMFLPGTEKTDLIDEQGLQMTLAWQKDF
jgi:hypothetical protein